MSGDCHPQAWWTHRGSSHASPERIVVPGHPSPPLRHDPPGGAQPTPSALMRQQGIAPPPGGSPSGGRREPLRGGLAIAVQVIDPPDNKTPYRLSDRPSPHAGPDGSAWVVGAAKRFGVGPGRGVLLDDRGPFRPVSVRATTNSRERPRPSAGHAGSETPLRRMDESCLAPGGSGVRTAPSSQ
jgi:hypothetical protein